MEVITRTAVVLRVVLLGFLYYVAAAAVLDSFNTHWAMGDAWRKSRFNRTLHFTVERPFVYRLLTPALIQGLTAVLPESVDEAFAHKTQVPRERYGWRQGNDTEYFVGHLLLFAALLATQVFWHRLLVHFRGPRDPVADLAPPALLLFLPLTFMQGGFIYDFPQLALVSALLLCFLKQRWPAFYACLALAVLNKESSLLIPVWFAARYGIDRDLRGLARHALGSAAVGLPLLLAVRATFADHPGSPVSFHLAENIRFLADPASYCLTFYPHAAGIPMPQGFHLFNLALLALILAVSFKRAPRLVWAIFVATCLAVAPLFLLFGWRDELRVFDLAFPALAVLVASGLAPLPPRRR